MATRQRTDVDKSGKLPRLPIGRSASPRSGTAERIKRFRRQLENAVAPRLEDADPVRCLQVATRIDTAVRSARLVLRIEGILEHHGDPGSLARQTEKRTQGTAESTATATHGLSHEQFLAYSTTLLRAKEAVDRAVRDLGELAPMPDPWAAIYAPQPAALPAPSPGNGPPSPIGGPPAPDAPTGQLDGLAGKASEAGNE